MSEIVWRPDPAVVRDSNVMAFARSVGCAGYDELAARASADPDWFWDAVLTWGDVRFTKPYTKVRDLSDGPEWARWCVGGETSLVLNTLDRHRGSATEAKPAVAWESETGERRTWTYAELDGESCRMAAALTSLGIVSGDVVGIYMPMVPETLAALYAILRIGATAMPLFSGFGADALAYRLAEGGARAVFTVDATRRRGRTVAVKAELDKALAACPTVRHVIVQPTLGVDVPWTEGRDHRWPDLTAGRPDRTDALAVAAEHRSILLFTSGTTGKPKGIVLTHCSVLGKMITDLYLCMDLKPDDRFMWFTDFGWAVGPFVAIATHMRGACLVIAEGTPDFPDQGRMWRLAEQHGVTILGTAPTAVRTMMSEAPDAPDAHDLSKVRVNVSGGEPWTEEAWMWFFEKVGKRKVPMLNWSGGTEIGGGILCGTVLQPVKPCAFTCSILGMEADVVDAEGNSVPAGVEGELVMRAPSIGLTRGMWNDPELYLDTYWRTFPGLWRHGDLAVRDGDGMWWVRGRADDTLKIAGKRAGPSEVEDLLLATGRLADAAAVGLPDPISGQAVACVCVPAPGVAADEALVARLKDAVAAGLGKPFRPRDVLFVPELPKNGSGKIVRRAIKAVLTGGDPGDLSTLANPESLGPLRQVVADRSTNG